MLESAKGEKPGPDFPDVLWAELNGRLWHATRKVGLEGIIADQKIMIGHRYRASFAAHMRCVSLFDFGAAAYDLVEHGYKWARWYGVDEESRSRVAVWLEIDRLKVREKLMDPRSTRDSVIAFQAERSPKEKLDDPKNLYIPGVEACHHGLVPLAHIAGVLLIDGHDNRIIKKLGSLDASTLAMLDAFEAALPPHEEPKIMTILRERFDDR